MKSKNQSSRKNQERKGNDTPKENPGRRPSEQEGSGYPHSAEQQQQQSGSDVSYSERVDVTPPKPHEFPSFGNAKTDFVSRKQGRTTGRMIGHEPGTEG
jgi:hypothetical protein